MGKYDRPRRWQVEQHGTYRPSAEHPIHGSAIMPRSIAPDRLVLDSLSAITANLGTVYSGTIYVGNVAQARVVIGDAADGIQAMLPTGQPYFALSNTDGAFSCGVRPGDLVHPWALTVRAGALALHGNALIDGTVTARALALIGSISRTLIDSDKLFIGIGDPNDLATCTGFYADMNQVGGIWNGVQTWVVDAFNGCIIARAAGADSHEFIQLGSDKLIVSNLAYNWPTMPRHGLHFQLPQPYYDADTGITTWSVQDLMLYSSTDGLNIVDLTTANDDAAALYLMGKSGRKGVELSEYGLTLNCKTRGTQMYLYQPDDYGADVYVTGDNGLRLSAARAPVLALTAAGAAIVGGPLAFTQDFGHPWSGAPELTTGRAEIYFDFDAHEWRLTDGNERFRIPNLEAITDENE